MTQSKPYLDLLAGILDTAIEFHYCDYNKYNYDEMDDSDIVRLTKQDIITLAHQLLPKELVQDYPNFKKEGTN